MARRTVTQRDYRRLLKIRTRLREFLKFSADQAAQAGLTANQHQLLLAVQGHDPEPGAPSAPTVGAVARYLYIRPNTAVELVDRVERMGLLRREPDADDHRVVRLHLTDDGLERLARLTVINLAELERVSTMIQALIADLDAP